MVLTSRGGSAAEPKPGRASFCGELGGGHVWVYAKSVKRRDLEKRLAECGWYFLRSGGRHDVWTDGSREEAIPRHREVNERLAQAILRRACGN